MHRLDSELFLSDILTTYPQVREVFLREFDHFADPDSLAAISPFIKLKTMLKMKNLDANSFLKLLEDAVNPHSGHNLRQPTQLETSDQMNLLALLPCPLKLPLEVAWDEFMRMGRACPDACNYLIASNANNQLSYGSYVDQFEDIDEMPDIVISAGINSFYAHRFIDKFIDKGLFVDAAAYEPNPSLASVGIKDPAKNYTLIAMNLLIMVVDKLQIGTTPIPQTWGDLLNPEFEKRVAIRGHANSFCETTLLTIYKQYGSAGIKKFAKAVKYGWHPAQMAKAAGSGSKDAPAVSVMPYFFAKTVKHKENIEIVWPKDGAVISPVTMLVKADKARQLAGITDFFTGRYVGDICARAHFPSLHPEVDNKIPEQAAFNWIGWDFIKANDTGELITRLNRQFMETFSCCSDGLDQ